MRENFMYGSVRGALGNRSSYRDTRRWNSLRWRSSAADLRPSRSRHREEERRSDPLSGKAAIHRAFPLDCFVVPPRNDNVMVPAPASARTSTAGLSMPSQQPVIARRYDDAIHSPGKRLFIERFPLDCVVVPPRNDSVMVPAPASARTSTAGLTMPSHSLSSRGGTTTRSTPGKAAIHRAFPLDCVVVPPRNDKRDGARACV